MKDVFQKLLYIIPNKEKKKMSYIFLLILLGAFFETLGVSMIIPLMQAMLNPTQLLEIPVVGTILAYVHAESSKDIIIYSHKI